MGSEKVAKKIASKVLSELPDEAPPPSCSAGAVQQLPDGIEKLLVKETPEAVEGVSWKKPTNGDEVTVHYVATLASDNSEFDSTRTCNIPFTFTMGKGQLVKGLDLAVATMKKGELAQFTFAAEYGYGEESSPPKVPANSALVFEIELINWIVKEDLFGDGGVLKRVLVEGSGWSCPKAGEGVLISLKSARVGDGDIIEDKKSFEYTLGSDALGPISKVVDTSLSKMKKGEHAHLQCSHDYSYGEKTPDGIQLDLELLELLETVDISIGKAALTKKRIKEGDWREKPFEGSKVKLHVESATDGESPLPRFSGPKLLEFIACNGEVCDALEFAVVEMRKGEKAVITSTQPSLFCDDALGLSDISAEKVVVTAELIDFEKGEEPWNMSEDGKYEYCTSCKDMGSALFKKGRHALVLQRYNRVLEIIGYTEDSSEDYKRKTQELKKLCELNKAACLLKTGDNAGVRAACDAVLKDDKDNIKAMFRRASAFFNGSEYAEAQQDLKRILELEPENAEAKRLLQQVQRAQRDADKGSKAMYANMCKGLGKLGTPDPVPLTQEQKFNQEVHKRADMSSKDAFKDLFYKPGEEIRSQG